MPELVGFDNASRCRLLEHLVGRGDFSFLYQRDGTTILPLDTLEEAAGFLAALHSGTCETPELRFSNNEMTWQRERMVGKRPRGLAV